MNVVKRNPENWLPSLLDDVLKPDWMGGTNGNTIGMNVPAVNILENEDTFFIELAAPGLKKENFNLELDNDLITISSQQKEEKKDENPNKKFTRREFGYSNFKRAFNLPESVDTEKISASYQHGVLTVTLPKREEAKVQPKRLIEIK